MMGLIIIVVCDVCYVRNVAPVQFDTPINFFQFPKILLSLRYYISYIN